MHCWIRRIVCSSHGGKTGPRYSSWKRRKGRDSKSVHTSQCPHPLMKGYVSDDLYPRGFQLRETRACPWPKAASEKGPHGHPSLGGGPGDGTRQPRSGRGGPEGRWAGCKDSGRGRGSRNTARKPLPACLQGAELVTPGPRGPMTGLFFFPVESWAGNSETGHNTWEIWDPAREAQS